MSDKTYAINFKTLKDPIVAEQADAPIVIHAITPSVDPRSSYSGGPLANTAKVHTYVNLGLLPRELAEKIKAAIDSLSWG